MGGFGGGAFFYQQEEVVVVGDSFFPGGPSRVVAAGSRPGHPEARGRSKSQERGGPGPYAKPDGQILVFWIIALSIKSAKTKHAL